MTSLKPVGRQASAQKYDLLTALGVHACRGDKHFQRLVLRLITLIVARYNWQGDEISVAQAEIAELWAVDLRTVKRDVAKLRDMGWLVQKRAAARGRVAVHGLDLGAILRATEADGPSVGPDYLARMSASVPTVTAPRGNVVAFPVPAAEGATPWLRVLARLEAEDPTIFAAWFRVLQAGQSAAGLFRVMAPSRFHATFVATHYHSRLLAALRREGLAAEGLEIVLADRG